jgi:hypothetical protein
MGLFSRKQAEEPELIDLREAEPAKAQWGSPVPCPTCDGRGYLDHIDPFKEIMFLHCTECGHKYEVTRAEIGAGDDSEAFTL